MLSKDANPLNGDTFVYADLPNTTRKAKEAENMEFMRDFLTRAGANDEGDDAVFDNFVGFYEITDTNGGIELPADEDIIA
ncbi:MAG: hypothetical protein AAGI06_15895 [Pseudomonadota bacterium]